MKLLKNKFVIAGIFIVVVGIGFIIAFNPSSNDMVNSRVFEEMEPEAYATLAEQGLLQAIDKKVDYDQGSILIEDVYYDKKNIVMGIIINDDDVNRGLEPHIMYEGRALNAAGGRKKEKLKDKYVLHAILKEPLPTDTEVTLALQTLGSTFDIPVEISRAKTDAYMTSYQVVSINNDPAVENKEMGMLYEGPYGITLELYDVEIDDSQRPIGEVTIRNQQGEEQEASRLSGDDGYIEAIFNRNRERQELIEMTSSLDIEIYAEDIEQESMENFTVELNEVS